MLLLSFKIGHDDYVIDTTDVVEIIPLVSLKDVPGSDTAVAGLLNYHGTSVPVIDLDNLCGQDALENTLTTRIILVRYKGEILGLITKSVSETLRLEESEFQSAGIKAGNNEFLGDIAHYENRFIQRVLIDHLLTDPIRQALFSQQVTGNEAG